MENWASHEAWREHREELLREAQRRQLEREAREARPASARSKERPDTVEVRWGLPDDDVKIAGLLELNGVPRWVAFEERFVVAVRDGAVMAAVRYRTEPERLLLGLLVVDPWSEERTLAPALYTGARTLALEVGASDVVARPDRHRAAHLSEAGYSRRGAVWSAVPSRPVERREGPYVGGWRRGFGRAGAFLGDLLLRRWLGRSTRPMRDVR